MYWHKWKVIVFKAFSRESKTVDGITTTHVLDGTDGSAQLAKYMKDGNLRAGFTMSPIEDIAVIGNYNMRIVFDNNGLASYSFYKYNDDGKRVGVTSSEVKKAYTKRAVLAMLAAGVLQERLLQRTYLQEELE